MWGSKLEGKIKWEKPPERFLGGMGSPGPVRLGQCACGGGVCRLQKKAYGYGIFFSFYDETNYYTLIFWYDSIIHLIC